MSRIPPPRRLVTRSVALAAALLSAGTVALAAGDPPAAAPGEASRPVIAPAPPAAAPKPEKPKLVCEQVEQMGSHFKRRVCATPEAWEARRRRDAAQMERMGDHGAGCGGVANPC